MPVALPPAVLEERQWQTIRFSSTPYSMLLTLSRNGIRNLIANDPYKALKATLRAEIDEAAWSTLNSDTSRPFDKSSSGRIAVKVINNLGDEVLKVFKVV